MIIDKDQREIVYTNEEILNQFNVKEPDCLVDKFKEFTRKPISNQTSENQSLTNQQIEKT